QRHDHIQHSPRDWTAEDSLMPLFARRCGIACLIAACGLIACLAAQEVRSGVSTARWRQHDIRRPKPAVIEPAGQVNGGEPPREAVILFDGTSLDAWKSTDAGPANWKVADGCLETVPGAGMIETKGKFGDVQLHVEWAAPSPPKGTGQD